MIGPHYHSQVSFLLIDAPMMPLLMLIIMSLRLCFNEINPKTFNYFACLPVIIIELKLVYSFCLRITASVEKGSLLKGLFDDACVQSNFNPNSRGSSRLCEKLDDKYLMERQRIRL